MIRFHPVVLTPVPVLQMQLGLPVHYIYIIKTFDSRNIYVSSRSTSVWAMYHSHNELSVLFINQTQTGVDLGGLRA